MPLCRNATTQSATPTGSPIVGAIDATDNHAAIAANHGVFVTRDIHRQIEDISRRLRGLSLEELHDVSERIAEIECNGIQHRLHTAAQQIVQLTDIAWDDEPTREWEPVGGTWVVGAL